ncbi:hypothetical protein A2U01_0072899, partial [Trifolium medium]|nr:hypothetical protein [Trifolium medium]
MSSPSSSKERGFATVSWITGVVNRYLLLIVPHRRKDGVVLMRRRKRNGV